MPPLIFHPIYSQLDLPIKHRFPIQKYQGIKDALIQKSVTENQFFTPEPITVEELKAVFETNYVQELIAGNLEPKKMRRIGFPWSEQLILRTRTAIGGTLLTAAKSLSSGLALNLTGGYHHAFANFGSGFCLFNDLYLAALHLLQFQGVDRVLIFDCDVHQGDGTAKLAERNSAVYTVSLHAEKNFPYRKQQSDLDFPLDKSIDDETYLATVEEALHLALSCAQPDAVIYDAGVDIHVDDDLGLLNISTDGIYRRDRLVIDTCLGRKIPVSCVIGGGYQRDISKLVDVHMQLFKAAGCY